LTLHEVVCAGCSRKHVMSESRAREQRVMRCDCGQFVRLDRGLSEADLPVELTDEDHDEATRAVTSLEDIEGAAEAFGLMGSQALKPAGSSGPIDHSDLFDPDDDEATKMVSSPLKLSALLPPAKGDSGTKSNPTSSSPTSSSPGSKPVWFVDLGGTGTVEMTIDKLIMARRSGKIGESAMVWRPGMARWRPVGTLIAAAGSGVARPGAEPRSKPINPKINLPPPSLPSMSPRRENSDPSLAVYDRPAATLEFAADASKTPPPIGGPGRSVPPKAPVRDPARARSAPPSNGSTQGVELGARSAPNSALGRIGNYVPPLPKWAAVAAPLAACLALAGAGALLVRSFRAPRVLPAMSAGPSTAAAIRVPKPEPAAAPEPTSEQAMAEPIIDVDSLSLEKKKRPMARPNGAAPGAPEASPPSEIADAVKADADEDEAEVEISKVKTRDKRDAGARKDPGPGKNTLEGLGERDEKNPFYNPGF
jgi:GYF domain 2